MRSTLKALCLWSLLAGFVLLLMSVDNPFRIALAAMMIATMGPVRQWIGSIERLKSPIRLYL